MKLAIDIDGVLYNFVKSLKQWVVQSTGREESEMEDAMCWNFFKDQWGYSVQEYKQFIVDGIQHGPLMWEGDIIEMARYGLYSLREQGHHVTLLTARCYPGFDNVAAYATKYWLLTNDMPHDNLIISNVKTGYDFDWYLDDAPHNIQELTDAGSNAIFFTQKWNEHVDHPYRVNGWKEAVSFFQEKA